MFDKFLISDVSKFDLKFSFTRREKSTSWDEIVAFLELHNKILWNSISLQLRRKRKERRSVDHTKKGSIDEIPLIDLIRKIFQHSMQKILALHTKGKERRNITAKLQTKGHNWFYKQQSSWKFSTSSSRLNKFRSRYGFLSLSLFLRAIMKSMLLIQIKYLFLLQGVTICHQVWIHDGRQQCEQ